MQKLSILKPVTPEGSQQHWIWGQLSGASTSLALLQTAKQYPNLLLVITENNSAAVQLEYELHFFNKGMKDPISVISFPDWETLPYDQFSPHQDLISQRLNALSKITAITKGIVITSITTLMHRLAPPSYLSGHLLVLAAGDKLNVIEFRRQLENTGYRNVDQVIEHGEFSIRGSILDIYPMGSEFPYRIDLFDEVVDSIRLFDPETQRSTDKINKIDLLPAHEFPLTESAITLFRQNWRAEFSGNPTQCGIYNDISEAIPSPGIEYYLKFFFDRVVSLLDYLPTTTLIFRMGDINTEANHFWQEIKTRYDQYQHDVTRPILPPNQVFIPSEELFGSINQNFNQIQIISAPIEEKKHQLNFAIEALPDLTIESRQENPLKKLESFLSETNTRVLFCAESAGRREALLELLHDIQLIPPYFDSWHSFLESSEPLGITEGILESGFTVSDSQITFITESQLLGQQVMQRRRRSTRRASPDTIVKDLVELKVNSPIVHREHGVGRYQGLTTLTIDELTAEYLTIQYAGNDKIYVPITSLHLISRYSGSDIENAPIHKLGSDQWEKAVKKSHEKIKDVAAELLDIYAQRQAQVGFSFKLPLAEYHTFCAGFPFEETPDQLKAIEEVISDMTSERPMDRLVCGDVGFGKTEVAMRAAFIAAHNDKQVALLVPTTLLAKQHYNNFKDRFANTSVSIGLLSRFGTKKENDTVIQGLQKGSIDIVIGTHKLLQQHIEFKDLGLIIVDEEHRFGVQQKEILKSIRANVDILNLTATPIPRTLNMAMSGLREISIITTPPQKRLSIKTFVLQRNLNVIREAILREIMRGGQVFFLHNEINTIQMTAQEIQKILPEAKVEIGHGQMHERDLEKVMINFYHRRFNVLLCTTIIENGIDIPTANTIIIDRADKFGLAQLHQLRGRVGRSHHQAYAYLIAPAKDALTKDAEKRLEAIVSLEELGSGFTLATHDLEIRGAGELLGEDQSGNIQEIGFSLYVELLENAVRAIKSGKHPELSRSLKEGLEIDLRIPALFPHAYIPDVHTRLTLYKRIANANSESALDDLQVELIDRFGLLPIETKNLFKVTELKLKAEKLGIKKIEANEEGGRIQFLPNPTIDPMKLITLVQKNPSEYKFDGPERLKFKVLSDTADKRIDVVKQIILKLH
ncbi:MAG: transcription-repair coupling factor [Proteobacteria bacterium]|nr:transcription-repair coupling factor [Pseudomonadota bacterium]